MIPPKMLDDIVHTLQRTPNACVTVDESNYRADGTVQLFREGRGWLLHRYLAHRLGIPLAPYMLPGCKTFGCMNPRHRLASKTPGHGQRAVCPNGHPYTPANTLTKGRRRCKKCRDERNVRRRSSTRREGYCIHGHELTRENSYYWQDKQGRTHRRCRRCTIDRMRERRAKPPIDTP